MTERRISFMFTKAILGASCGFLMSACQTYISETSPRDLRGLFLGFYAFNVSLGHLLAISVVFSQSYGSKASSYMIPFASQWALGGWAMVVSLVLPESPVWLAGRNEIEKAKKALRRLGTEQMLPDIVRTMETERDELGTGDATPSYKECFQGTNLRRTLIVMFLSTIQQFVGMSLMANGAYFLTMAGMSSRYSLMVNLIGIASNIFANAVSWYTIPKYGRRRMTLISLFLDCLAWATMGIAGCFQSDAAGWMVGVALLLFGFFNSFGVGSAVPVLMSEVSSVRLRSKTAGVGFTTQALSMWAFNFFTPYMYNKDELNWGGKIGFFFLGLGTIAFVITWFAVPETKGRSFSEIDHLFETKVVARKFSKTTVSAEDTDGSEDKGRTF
ncbi:MFS transporter fmqE [Colletotrichum tropicale]|nr:MFS transporter fmqE [Colletotrichum tropicale]